MEIQIDTVCIATSIFNFIWIYPKCKFSGNVNIWQLIHVYDVRGTWCIDCEIDDAVSCIKANLNDWNYNVKTTKLLVEQKQSPSINSSRSRCSRINFETHLAACMRCSIAKSFDTFIIAKILNLFWCFIPALPTLKLQFKMTMFLLLLGTINCSTDQLPLSELWFFF